jgi:hypothetical protein
MNRKLVGLILSASGLLFLAAGLAIVLAVVPSMKKMPADTDVERTYSGTMNVVLDPSTYKFKRDLPIELVRRFKVAETDGDAALVAEDRVMTTAGVPLEQIVSHYAIDRVSMLALAKGQYPSAWNETEGMWPREGIVLSWPIGTEKEDYVGWSDDYRATVPLTFQSEETYAASGLTTYKFASASPPKPIAAEQVKAMGLPTELNKVQLAVLIAQADLGALAGLVRQQLPTILESWPQSTVPLSYYYEYEGEYWIEPTTGVMIDTKKHEVRTVGLGEELISASPLALLPEEQRAMLRVPVSDFSYTTTAASIKDAIASVQDDKGRLTLFGTTLPIILIAIGALDLAGAFYFLRRTAA